MEKKSVQFVDAGAQMHAELNAAEHVVFFDIRFPGESSALTVSLNAEEAKCEIYSIYIGAGEDKNEQSHKVEHNAANTSSVIEARIVLMDQAELTYSGMIAMENSAKAASGRQHAAVLSLSKNAKIHAQPDLEIKNNDVRCSHGVSITRLNQEKLFFTASRGVEQKDAVSMLVQAHVSPVLEQLPKDMHEIVKEKLAAYGY